MQTFKDAIAEFIARSRELLDRESPEDLPPPPPAPVARHGPPVSASLRLTEHLIRRYAWTMGDDNPLYIDPGYGERSPIGSQIAPGTILVHVRYPADHGAQRPEGYPVANFLSGVVWEFYDLLRPGMRFLSSKIPRELVVGRGPREVLISHHSETSYWDTRRELVAKAYGRLIHVPVEQMGSSRSMPMERLGERMFYDKEPHYYDEPAVRALMAALGNEQRRGAEPRFWEDVKAGEELPPIAQPPYSIRDEVTYQSLHHGLTADYGGARLARAFGPAYRRCRTVLDFARTNPATHWPYTPYDEHEDRFLCAYRCEPLPFDFGIQRAQIPLRLLTNWAGDGGFVRRMFTTMRRPTFYGDAAIFHGQVIRTYTVPQLDDSGNSSVYAAVAIKITGTDQTGAMQTLGYATVYLPSRRLGPPRLPVPHPSCPAYVPFDTHRLANWY